MSAGVAQAPVRAVTNTRRFPRFPLSVPADITVLRSGIPYTIPGRSITLGERGLGVVLAGEVQAGDPVGLEFRLPDSDGRLRLRAVVRYQALLQCGLEFQNMTAEQQTLIEHWTRKKSAATPQRSLPAVRVQASAPPLTDLPITVAPAATRIAAPVVSAEPKQMTRGARFRPALWAVLAAALVSGALGWWYWRRAWDELESQLPVSKALAQTAPTTIPAEVVPAEVMEKLITHKIEPIYPEAARRANTQGIVVLETLIGSDGSVVDVRAVSGPEELSPAAVDAVKWWRFQPYLVNGQAVRVKTTLAIQFRAD
jgi:TonB family protein